MSEYTDKKDLDEFDQCTLSEWLEQECPHCGALRLAMDFGGDICTSCEEQKWGNVE